MLVGKHDLDVAICRAFGIDLGVDSDVTGVALELGADHYPVLTVVRRIFNVDTAALETIASRYKLVRIEPDTTPEVTS